MMRIFACLLLLGVVLAPAGVSARRAAPTPDWEAVAGLYVDAEAAFARGEDREGQGLLRRLVREAPDSPWAPRGWLRSGRAYEAAGDSRRALRAYRQVLERYPASDEFAAAVERKLALYLARLETPRRFGFLREDPGVRIGELVEKAPYAPRAEDALYALGRHYARGGRHRQAADVFARLTRSYPEGRHAPAARFERAGALFAAYRRRPVDGRLLEDAWHQVSYYLAAWPEGAHAAEAGALAERIREKQAARVLEVALFYERTGRPEAARLTLREVVAEFPDTAAAGRAADRRP